MPYAAARPAGGLDACALCRGRVHVAKLCYHCKFLVMSAITLD